MLRLRRLMRERLAEAEHKLEIENVLATLEGCEMEDFGAQANHNRSSGNPLVLPPRLPNRRDFRRALRSTALRMTCKHDICDETIAADGTDCITQAKA